MQTNLRELNKKAQEITSVLDFWFQRKLVQSHIFSVLKTLKRHNPGDMYYEAYRGHYLKQGSGFTDVYMIQFLLGAFFQPKRILEIGTRTGISLCQLLSGYIDHDVIEEIAVVDPFLDDFITPGIVKMNLKVLNLPIEKVDFHVGLSQHVLPNLIEQEKKYDYILVDGDHSPDAALEDLRNAEKLIDKNGVILFDDISQEPGECGLLPVWEEWKNLHRVDGDFDFGHDIHGKGVAWAVKHG